MNICITTGANLMKDDINIGDYILFDMFGTVNVGYVLYKGESHYRVQIPDMMVHTAYKLWTEASPNLTH